jgi:HAD superfamily hydrolase (TIGR01549 family)
MSIKDGLAADGMIELVMWDLDETMLPTEHLRTARHSPRPCSLEHLPEFAITRLHHGISDALRQTSSVAKAVVTSSPRWYVDQLLGEFLSDVTFDAVVTYDDVSDIKPNPEPLLAALRITGTAPDRSVYIGDNVVDYEACARAGVRFLGAGWVESPTFPGVAQTVAHPRDVMSILGQL